MGEVPLPVKKFITGFYILLVYNLPVTQALPRATARVARVSQTGNAGGVAPGTRAVIPHSS